MEHSTITYPEGQASRVEEENATPIRHPWKELHALDATVLVPSTSFTKMIKPKDREDQEMCCLARWETEHVASLASNLHAIDHNTDEFVLEDGPPFANGPLHLGHAYNKVFKDMICKSRRMMGRSARLRLGWDCHGLPIELKVTSTLPAAATTAELIKSCRSFAQKWIEVQRAQLRRLGILANAQDDWSTMSRSYEAEVLRSLGKLADKQLLERKLHTTAWCTTCRSVLANAELEPLEEVSASVYVLFHLPDAAYAALPALAQPARVSWLIWTTSAWSLPMCRALLIASTCNYVLVTYTLRTSAPDQVVAAPQCVVVSAAAIPQLTKALSAYELRTVATVSSAALRTIAQCGAQSPVIANEILPVLVDDTVSPTEGTGVLHLAPGCGPKDYNLGCRLGIETYSPVDVAGRYVPSIRPAMLAGLTLKEGDALLLDQLAKNSLLLHQATHPHLASTCWRCGTVAIHRATQQWFCRLNSVTDNVLRMAEEMTFQPRESKAAFTNILRTRHEWCLSRQRRWAPPIPALECSSCGHSLLTYEIACLVADKVVEHGIEYWTRTGASVAQMQADGGLPARLCCAKCGNSDVSSWRLSADSVDVWFVSGLAHVIRTLQSPKSVPRPADVLVEGKDQLRGWFSASLIVSALFFNQPNTRSLVCHGFCLSGRTGAKLSKKNEPAAESYTLEQVLSVHHGDRLRLWVASTPAANDMRITDDVLLGVRKDASRLRKTFYYLLAFCHDYRDAQHRPALSAMCTTDLVALAALDNAIGKVLSAYERNDFATSTKIIMSYAKTEVRGSFHKIARDRIYLDARDCVTRRSAQAAAFTICDSLCRLVAPTMSFLAEEVWSHLYPGRSDSIHVQRFAPAPEVWRRLRETRPEDKQQEMNAYVAGRYKQAAMLARLRTAALSAIAKSKLGSGASASVTVSYDASKGDLPALLDGLACLCAPQPLEMMLAEAFCCAEVVLKPLELGPTPAPFSLQAAACQGRGECLRCWRWLAAPPASLCSRCERTVAHKTEDVHS